MDFKPETDSPCIASQDLAHRLVKARMVVESGSSSSQEEKEVLDSRINNSERSREQHGLTTVMSGGDRSTGQQCSAHPAVLLEYWCEEDCRLVCKDCLIFGDHKGHTAVSEEKRQVVD